MTPVGLIQRSRRAVSTRRVKKKKKKVTKTALRLAGMSARNKEFVSCKHLRSLYRGLEKWGSKGIFFPDENITSLAERRKNFFWGLKNCCNYVSVQNNPLLPHEGASQDEPRVKNLLSSSSSSPTTKPLRLFSFTILLLCILPHCAALN